MLNMGSEPKTMEEMMSQDPTLITEGHPDDANGAVPDPPMRYGEPLPDNWIPLYCRPQRTPTRRLRVACIGAGISAMNLAYRFYHSWKDTVGDLAELVIYEANDNIGGTWLVNTYPGVACDVPAHIYTFTFEPNPNWSAFYATGEEILAYFKETVAKYKLDRDVKCGHRVSRAVFDETNGKWHLSVTTSEREIADTVDVLVSAVGFLSKWRWPQIKGLDSFGGEKMHSAAWNSTFDPTGKKIAVIGNGSSAIQILPQIVDTASHVTNFIRRPTYITPGLGSAIIDGQTQHIYTEEEKQKFRDNKDSLTAYRKRIQAGSNRAFDMFVKNSQAQITARRATSEKMKQMLKSNEFLTKSLIPDYEIGCRRATPGPGYLEAFTRDDVTLVTDAIDRVDKRGIWTNDGKHHTFDAIVCATGFDVSHKPPFPLIGKYDQSLADVWSIEPRSYLSLCVSGFPNFFTFSGPNAPVGHGSLMAGLGWSADYICKWIQKLSQEDIKYIDVTQDALDDFNTYSDEIMQTLAWSGGCHSWYKNHRADGRVTAVWAGSVISYHDMIRELRPEDFQIAYRSKNRFRFMGNGRTKREYDPDADLAWYLSK